MTRFPWMVWCIFLWMPCSSLIAQPGERLGLRVELDSTIRSEFALKQDGEYKTEMQRLGQCMVDELNAYHWDDFCWELTSQAEATRCQLVVSLHEDSDRNWFMEAKLRAAVTKSWGKLKVRYSDEWEAKGAPRLASFQDLLNRWFCEEYLSRNLEEIHKELRERLPVGLGLAQRNGNTNEYSVYVPERFKHFHRSSFSIDAPGRLVIVEGSGNRTPDQFQNARCMRIHVRQTISPEVPPPFQGAAYLIKYQKSSGATVGAAGYESPLPVF